MLHEAKAGRASCFTRGHQEPIIRSPAVVCLLTARHVCSGQDSSVLELSSALVGRACKAAPGAPQYAVEAGYQALLQGDVQGALAQYSRASHLHELDMEAMYGSIECDLLVGKVCGLHLIVFQADRPFLTVFHACVVSCSGCPFSAYMLQSKHRN